MPTVLHSSTENKKAGSRMSGSWADQEAHFHNALTHPWYKAVFLLSASIVSEASRYFESLGYLPALAPVTTHSISSPMGLGSDSLPVKIDLFGHPTFLADSMQFHLEYLLRVYNKGVFYVMPTFRGEPSDERHLSEFFHIEAELPGDMEDMISDRGVDPTPYEWYLRLKQEFPLQTAGFGIGLERLLLWALKHDDIRDTQIFVRQRGLHFTP